MSHWLDDVARQVAQGGVSRRSLLRRLGTGVVVGTLAALGRGGTRVEAQVPSNKRCLIGAAPDTVFGCPTGQTCCPSVNAQGICCPAGTLCTGSLTTCGVCPAGTVICGGGTTAVCCPTATTTCISRQCCPNAQACGTAPTQTCCGAGTVCQGGTCRPRVCPAGADVCGTPPDTLGCNGRASCRCVTTTEGRTFCAEFSALVCGVTPCSISEECPGTNQCVLVEGCCTPLGQPPTPVCLPGCAP